MFFVATALMLTTVGVFAGKAKFITNALYAYNGTKGEELAPSYVNFATAGITPATINDQDNHSYGVYSYTTGTGYTRLYLNDPL